MEGARRHAKVVEQGVLVIVRVGAHGVLVAVCR